ncbi:non-ribosomal peptide synthetase [Shouchella miscanthi]|uniref:non-ribosomal peptide synthetase n=1 Tax=Shouchella miscanthi TaxID=2598861 RepID=UPI0011A932CC|nr:non-ribosomal peptide synthetase [Shouchella miscanthi]
MLHKEKFLKLSQDQKRQYLLDIQNKGITNDNSHYEITKQHRYPKLKKNVSQKFDNFPLTDIQESFLIGRFYGASQDMIGCHIYCEFEKKNLSIKKMKHSWMELVRHHEMLHTIIHSSGEQSIQFEVPEFDMPVHDFRMAEHKDVEVHKTKVRDELSHKVYKASQWPLFDLQFTLLPEENVLIHLSIDEWIVDAASVDLLLDQWYQLYHDPSYTLPSLDVSFRDVVMAWKEFEESSVFQRDLTYWMGKLENAPGGPSLSINRAPKPREGYSYFPRYRLAGELEEDLWDRLKEKAKELEISPTVLLVTLFSQTLEEYSESDSFSLIQTYFNRLPLHPKLDQVVGPFISTNIFISNQETNDWKKQAQANQKQMWEDLDHSSVSGVRAMRELRVKSKNKAVPNFPVVFTSMLNNVGKAGQGRTNWFHYMTYNITQTPQVYLDHQVSERNGVLHFNWDVAEGYLSRQLVEDMFKRYQDRLRDIVKEDEEDTSSMIFSSFELTDLQQTYVIGRLQDGNEQSCQIYQEFQVEQLNVSRLQKAWQQLIEHHEMLQAVVHENGTQEILDRVPVYDIPVHVVQSVPEMEVRVQQVREELQEQVFPLGKWPLFDLRVTQGSEASYVHLCTDALIADGASLSLLYQQLMNLYNNPKTELLPLEMSYRDYCNHIREERQSIKGQKAREYWERKMDTIVSGPQLSSQIDASRTVMQGVVSDWQALKEKATRRDVKPGTVLLTAFQEVLAAYFGEAFTTVVVNWDRPPIHEQVKDIIGDFTTLSYVESRSTEQSFTHKVLLNEKEIKEDLSHRSVSGMHGLRKRAMSQKSGGFLSFPIVFTNLVDDDKISLAPGWEMGKSFSKTPGVYLDMIPVEKNNALHFHWDLMEGLLPLNVVQALFSRYSERLAELASDEEKWEEQALERQTSTSGTIHEWFERQVTTYSQNIALKWNQEVVTYQTLNERSNQLARYLQSQGVGPEVMVGVCVERSLDMMVGILGILKAGGAYVPLDPAQPKDRLAYILADSDVSLVLTKETVLSSLPETKATLICLDKDRDLWSTRPITNLHVPMNIDNLAYVIYTSGSTGRPKGVLVTHQNVVRLMRETEEWYHFNESDTWTLYHSYAFDFSVWEIWGALLYGGKLIIVPYKTSRSFESFYRLLIEEGVTVLNQTPTAFRQLMRIDEQQDSKSLSLRYIIFGGEALDPRILEGWFERHGDQSPQLVNMYGITETTVHVTYRRMTKGDVTSPTSVIGSPIQDLQVYILDEDLQPVPRGSVGEMYIGGAGVARGYLNQDQLTKERFISSPFKSTERLYKTGDLAHYTETEELAFAGRNDNQVKVRGFRIELGEIEAALKMNELIEDAVIIVKDDLDEQHIIAYVVANNLLSTTTIRQKLRNLLPEYMIPNLVIPITKIPITLNGKLDYASLPDYEIKEKKAKHSFYLKDAEILNCFTEVINREVSLRDNLFDLGITSIQIVKIAQNIKNKFGVSVPIEIFLDSNAINDITNYVMANNTQCIEDFSTSSSTTQYLMQIIEGLTGCRLINENENIFDAGVTSLTIMKISQKVKEEKGIDLPVEVFLENSTVSDISKYISDKKFKVESEIIDSVHQNQSVALENIDFQDQHYILRRNSLNGNEFCPMSIDKLSELLGLLKTKNSKEKSRYLYPSAGGKYAVQTYVFIKNRGVEGIDPGIYYYHPEKHGLVLIQKIEDIKERIFEVTDQVYFEDSNLCLFFIAQLESLTPFYGDFSKGLALLDGGYINQLLLSRMFSLNLKARVINAMDFSSIRDLFKLDDTHLYIHSICIGHNNELVNEYKSDDIQSTLKNYLLNKKHEIVPVTDMDNTIQYPTIDSQTLEKIIENKVHIRHVRGYEDIILLKEDSLGDEEYYVRASQRVYDKSTITFKNFSRFLSLLQPNKSVKDQYLYYNLLPVGSIKMYLYIKKGVVQDVEQGFYRYDQENHQLLLVKKELEIDLEQTHSPFNRKHYRNSGFCLFITTDKNEIADLYMNYAKQFALFEAGNIGQLLMDRQAEFDIGLVPIGGNNFEKIKEDFSFTGSDILLHSFFGGPYKHTYLRKSEDLLKVKTSNKVELVEPEHNIKQLPTSKGIAIIGLSGRYPEAINMDEYWLNLKNGRHSITRLSKERSRLYDNDDRSREQWGGFVQDIDQFDSLLFNISPSEAKNMDPQERMALQTVWECFEDAGYTVESLKKKAPEVGVFVGAMWNDYQNYGEKEWENNQQARVASMHSSIANRISHFFGLIGPSISVNTSCSSSLTAIHLAQESIKRGECDAAIVVGVNLISHPYHYDSLQQQGLLSINDKSAAFSAEGTGLIPGEGVGAILIKPIEDAIIDKDQVYALIKGSVLNHYGEDSRYGSPNKKMQVQSIQKLLSKTQTPVDTIDYIECAATGSSLADATEYDAIKEVFQKQSLKIGSVKPNIGHLESASSMSQLSKVLLQFKNEKIAPTIHSKPLNPFLKSEDGQVEIINQLETWKTSKPKLALISSYGAMGSIGHLLVKEYKRKHTRELKTSRPEVFLFSAESKEQLKTYAKKFLSYLDLSGIDKNIHDIAFTLHVGRKKMKERMAIIAENKDDLKNKLEAYMSNQYVNDVYTDSFEGAEDRNEWTGEFYNAEQIAAHWIKGLDVDIEKFFEKGQRISLPTYPFEKESHWYKKDTLISRKVVDKDISNYEDISMETSNEIEALEEYLFEIISEITEIPFHRLDKGSSFESYGINSLLITALNEKLEKDFGITSKTLFFENRTIEDLAISMNSFKEKAISKKKKFKPANNENQNNSQIENNADEMDNYSNNDIAIIGVSGKYAQSDDISELWKNLKAGKDCITEIPSDRWDNEQFFNSDKSIKGNIYGKWGGFIKDVIKFDPLFFNISPKEAERTDPQERLFLQNTWECIEDAGYTRSSIQRKYQGEVGVFVGSMYQEYQLYGHLEKQSSENVALGSSAGSIASRVSYFFDFNGPSLAIDTMCSSALTSLHYAVESVKRKECKVAVVGGVNLLLHPNKYLMHSQMNMLSSDGRCRSFGKGGDGFVPGEGIGSILIKPLKEAIKDGDNIYAVIKGTAINNDGKTNGYTVPNPKKQTDVIKKALDKAQVNPRTITYLEAHGTGTELGDPIEIQGLTDAYKAYTEDNQFCAIGSIKSNIGHCESAAGIAGLTKVILQLKHSKLLPSIHADEINPNIDFKETPFFLQTSFKEWDQPKAVIEGVEVQFPRRAGISSFGAGGVNAHIVLEEYVPVEHNQTKIEDEQEERLILLSANSNNELTKYAESLFNFLERPLKRLSKINKEDLRQYVTEQISALIEVESTSLDFTEDLGQVLDPFSFKELDEQLKKKYGDDIEIPLTFDEVSINTIVNSILEVLERECEWQNELENSKEEITRLKDISYTLMVGREPMPHRLALIVSSTDELAKQLSKYLSNPTDVRSSSSLLAGVNQNKVDAIWEDRDIKNVVTKWINEKRWKKLAHLWIKGVDISGSESSLGCKRISLPTYPFINTNSYWPYSIREKRGEQENLELIHEHKANMVEQLSSTESTLTAKQDTIDTCVEIICDAIKLTKSDLNVFKSFNEYGVDSILITEISEKIKDVVGLEIRAVDFFQAATIEEFLNSLPIEKSIKKTKATIVCTPENISPERQDRIDGEFYEEKQPKDHQSENVPLIEPIAIIGMSGKMPGTETLDEFWESICDGDSQISLIPRERWDWEQYYGDPLNEGDFTDVKYGGFIKDIDKFDSSFFGISPKEAVLMDPQQRLFLETTWKAIEDSGYKSSDIKGSKTGVFVGVSNKDYDQLLAENNVPVEAHLATGNSHAILANRVSYFYNFNGPSEAIDTACSSSVVAIHRAINSIHSNECDMAIAGGVNVLLTPKDFITYRKAGMLSPTDKVKTFNENADGYIRGEGVGAIVLKPLSKAKADGDNIYAVIRGSAVNHSGKGYALTVPSADAQAKVIKESWHKAGIDPSTLSYIEAQGTGTKMGDAIEINAFKKAFEGTVFQQKCGIGSVKPNIGHLESASGMASMFKVIKSINNKVIPMTANITEINKEIELADTPFYISDKTIPWVTEVNENGQDFPRRASVHSFGVGGTNAHLIIEEYIHRQEGLKSTNNDEHLLFLCSAKSEDQLLSYVRKIKDHVKCNETLRIEDLIYTFHVGREDMEERIAIIIDGKEDFLNKCNQFLSSPDETFESIYRSSLDMSSSSSLNSLNKLTVSPDPKSYNGLVAIAKHWVQLTPINWDDFYNMKEVKKVPLPTYPFKKVKRWIDLPTNRSNQLVNSNRKTEEIGDSHKMHVDTSFLRHQLVKAVADLLGYDVQEIKPNISLASIGMDSVSVMKLQYILEKDFNLSISLKLLNNNLSIDEIFKNISDFKVDQEPFDIDKLTDNQLNELFLALNS